MRLTDVVVALLFVFLVLSPEALGENIARVTKGFYAEVLK